MTYSVNFRPAILDAIIEPPATFKGSVREKRSIIDGFRNAFQPFEFGTNPGGDSLTFKCLVKYWSKPNNLHIVDTGYNFHICAYSMASHSLAVRKISTARRLILLGSFLEECHEKGGLTNLLNEPNLITDENHPMFFKQHETYTNGRIAALDDGKMHAFLEPRVPRDNIVEIAKTHSSESKEITASAILTDYHYDSRGKRMIINNKGSKKLGPEKKPKAIAFKIRDENGRITEIKDGAGNSMRALLTNFAKKDLEVSLKSLRFSINGKTLFLSTIGKKTPEMLSIKDGTLIDCINVGANPQDAICHARDQDTDDESVSPRTPTKKKRSSAAPKNKQKKNKSRKRGKGGSNSGSSSSPIYETGEDYKLEHSKKLSLLFEEAESKFFKAIRNELNIMNVRRTPPKVHTVRRKENVESDPAWILSYPSDVGLGGKAGKTSYTVRIGEFHNLYKTSKSSAKKKRWGSPCSGGLMSDVIDLHGLTRKEGRETLENRLSLWLRMANEGDHPWVITVKIICGGGNQFLAEMVEEFISSHETVANAMGSRQYY